MKTIRVLMSAMVLVMTGCGMNDQTALTSSDIAKKAMDAKQYTGDEANKTRQYFSSRDVSSAGVGDKYDNTTTYVGEEANKTRGYAYDRGVCNVEHGSQCNSPTTGATGATGSNGSDGVAGAPGTNGTNGSDGATGATGSNGSDGSGSYVTSTQYDPWTHSGHTWTKPSSCVYGGVAISTWTDANPTKVTTLICNAHQSGQPD